MDVQADLLRPKQCQSLTPSSISSFLNIDFYRSSSLHGLQRNVSSHDYANAVCTNPVGTRRRARTVLVALESSHTKFFEFTVRIVRKSTTVAVRPLYTGAEARFTVWITWALAVASGQCLEKRSWNVLTELNLVCKEEVELGTGIIVNVVDNVNARREFFLLGVLSNRILKFVPRFLCGF